MKQFQEGPAWGSVVEHLPIMNKALSYNSSSTTKQTKSPGTFLKQTLKTQILHQKKCEFVVWF